MANKPNLDTTKYELEILGRTSVNGSYEMNLFERCELINKIKNSDNNYQIKILIREIKNIEIIIDRFAILYLKTGRELPPEMKGYKPYKKIDEHPEINNDEDSEKFKGEWEGTKIELVIDLREDKKNGIFNTYAESYRHAEKHITVNGKPVKAKNLESLYYKTQSTNKNNI